MNTPFLKIIFIFILFWVAKPVVFGQNTHLKLALMKYNGGGDWYADPTSLPNLIHFCNRELNTNIDPDPATVEPGSIELFNYPFVHITGHGNIILSNEESQNLRLYLEAGGFLYIDDNYGLNQYIRREMHKVFPEQYFVELGTQHPIFHQKFNFPNGLPKIHEHDNKRPQGFGLFIDERLVCFYTYESDITDGWEDPSVHNDTPEVRRKALEMGANIISFVFNN